MDLLISLPGELAAVTTLTPHPNDPGGSQGSRRRTFLTVLTITVPTRTTADVVDDTVRREAVRARELAADGVLLRLWSLPATADRRRTLGLWSADDEADLLRTLQSLPLYRWMTVDAHVVGEQVDA